MKLKYTYTVETWAEDKNYGPSQSQQLPFESYEVEFLFNEIHQIDGIAVYIPNVELPRKEGKLYLPSFPEETAKAYEVASFFANLLHYQTGKGVLLEAPNEPQAYLPETDEETDFCEKRIANSRLLHSWKARTKGAYDFSLTTLERYSKVEDALTIYADARRLTESISKFREFYRVLEHFFPKNGEDFDKAVSQYLVKFSPKFTEDTIRALRELRNKCSHAKRDFITSADWEGLNQIRIEVNNLQEIAGLLLENPPEARKPSNRWR